MTKIIYVMRHGEWDYDKNRLVDPNQVIQSAEGMASRLETDLQAYETEIRDSGLIVYHSKLPRAVRTAHIVGDILSMNLANTNRKSANELGTKDTETAPGEWGVDTTKESIDKLIKKADAPVLILIGHHPVISSLAGLAEGQLLQPAEWRRLEYTK